jgi:ATP-dependent Lhr-like helicase
VLAQHTGHRLRRPVRARRPLRGGAARSYSGLSRADFDAVVGFVENGGYAPAATSSGGGWSGWRTGGWRWPTADRARRMDVGTIVEATTLKVRLGRGRVLGEVEEHCLGLTPGDTFLFAGRLLRFEGIRDMAVEASRATGDQPKIPAYAGGRMPLTTHLADRVRAMLADPASWAGLPRPVHEWLDLQRWRSVLPGADDLLVETFPRGRVHYLVAYCFEGRNAHQTLGMLLTRRMERAGLKPLGFVATDYVVATWSLVPVADPAPLFDEDMLGDDLEEWMAESTLLKRTFRNVAVIAGLIERRHPGQEKTGRQVTFNADLIYDVLRRHEPDHVLLRATRADAAEGLTDVRRLARLLARVRGRVLHRPLRASAPGGAGAAGDRPRRRGGARDHLLRSWPRPWSRRWKTKRPGRTALPV